MREESLATTSPRRPMKVLSKFQVISGRVFGGEVWDHAQPILHCRHIQMLQMRREGRKTSKCEKRDT